MLRSIHPIEVVGIIAKKKNDVGSIVDFVRNYFIILIVLIFYNQ